MAQGNLTFGAPLKEIDASTFWDPSSLAGKYNFIGASSPAAQSNTFGGTSNFTQYLPPGFNELDSFEKMMAYQAAQSMYNSDPKRAAEQIQALSPLLKEMADYKHKQAIEANIAAASINAFNKLPDAFARYAYAGREYDPTRIEIAARSRIPTNIPDLRSNVPSKRYFQV